MMVLLLDIFRTDYALTRSSADWDACRIDYYYYVLDEMAKVTRLSCETLSQTRDDKLRLIIASDR
jgi:hypothetical protein